MTSSDRCDVIYPTTQFYTRYQQPVTIKAQTCPPIAGQGVDWKQAKMIEGSSDTTKAGSWKGTGRRIKGQEKKLILAVGHGPKMALPILVCHAFDQSGPPHWALITRDGTFT